MGYPERTVLLTAALAAACSGRTETPPVPNKTRDLERQEQVLRRRPSVCCCGRGSSSGGDGGGQPANPLASNFSAFSHDVGWLLRTGALADVVLVLPSRPTVELGAVFSDIGEEHDEKSHVRAAAGDAAHDQDSGAQAGDFLDEDGRRRSPAVSLAKQEAAKGTNTHTRFLAHSMVLAARSEKFAAMLRFVRRQDDNEHVCADSEVTAGDGTGIEMDVAENVERAGGMGCRATLICEGCRVVLSCGSERGDVGAPEEATCCGELQNDGNNEAGLLPYACSYRRRRSLRRPRLDPTPRELELHSPLLSSRSLGLFLEFLYTGVLNPSLSTGELSELALIADEYLVPDLTRQMEALLVESLVRRCRGPSLECSHAVRCIF